jgi:hypothetical protein
MRVILDRETFGASAASLQPVADRVASEVDNLIPGTPSDYPENGIICFEPESSWSSDPSHPAPITLIGPKLLGEPAATSGNTIRIALYGVKPDYQGRLIYQLSHELAHVKMGVRASNYLVETFAVAVPYEVLRRMDADGYAQLAKALDLAKLPEQVQAQLNAKDWPALEAYWQSGIASQTGKMNDRPFQTLGYLLLGRSGEPNWAFLLSIAYFDDCNVTDPQFPTRICSPDTPRMARLGLNLNPLGYRVDIKPSL